MRSTCGTQNAYTITRTMAPGSVSLRLHQICNLCARMGAELSSRERERERDTERERERERGGGVREREGRGGREM